MQPSYLLYMYFVLCVSSQMNTIILGSSNWSRCNWGEHSGRNCGAAADTGAVGSGHVRLVLTRDATGQGCWCMIVPQWDLCTVIELPGARLIMIE